MHADLLRRAFAGDSRTAMPNYFLELLLADRGQDFCKGPCCPTRGIAFHSMMHFDNFKIERRSQYLCRLARQPEERVNPGRIIGGKNDRNLRLETGDLR